MGMTQFNNFKDESRKRRFAEIPDLRLDGEVLEEDTDEGCVESVDVQGETESCEKPKVLTGIGTWPGVSEMLGGGSLLSKFHGKQELLDRG